MGCKLIKKNIKIMISIFSISILMISGCIEINPEQNNNDKKNLQNNNELFVGTWSGLEKENSITINMTLYSNLSGHFDDNPITWNIKNDKLEISMFSGSSITYYDYNFSNDYNTLTIENQKSTETIVFQKIR